MSHRTVKEVVIPSQEAGKEVTIIEKIEKLAKPKTTGINNRKTAVKMTNKVLPKPNQKLKPQKISA